MIGGTIQAIYRFEDRLSIVVRGHGVESGERLVVDAVPEARKLRIGDDIWWQSHRLYWSPLDEPGLDAPIARVGTTYHVEDLWPRVEALCRQGVCPICSYAHCMHDGEGVLWCHRCDGSFGSPHD